MGKNQRDRSKHQTPADLSHRIASTYALAQLVTGDEEAASRLVRVAFERIEGVGPSDPGSEGTNPSTRLFALIVAAAGSGADLNVTGFERVQARHVLDRLFGPAFFSLDRHEKLALYLAEVEGLRTADVATVLGTSETQCTILLDSARSDLWDNILDSASVAETEILLSALPDSWLGPLMKRALRDAATPPGQLVESVAKALRDRANATTVDRTPVRQPFSFARIATPVSLILLVGMIGYAAATILESKAPDNLLSMTAALVNQTDPQLVAPSHSVANEFILDQIGRDAAIPVIAETLFRGAGIVRITALDRAPALYYDDLEHGGKLVVTIYNYEQLARLEQSTVLPAELLTALRAENALFTSRTSQGAVAAWRHRADVYVATGPAASIQTLNARLTFVNENEGED